MRAVAGATCFVLAIVLGAAGGAGPRDLADCQSGVADRALAACTKVIDDSGETAANRVLAHDRRGYIHLMRRELEAAIADFTAALRDEPDRPFSLYARGMARLFSGDAAGQNEMESALLRWPGIAEEFKAYGK